MGFENRDYARTDNRSYSTPRSRMSIVGWIIAINVAAFAVQCVWTRPMMMSDLGGHLPPDAETRREYEDLIAQQQLPRISILQDWFELDRRVVLQGQIWRLATYDLMHSTSEGLPWHLLCNMYFLYILGRKIIDVYSEREFALMYLASSIASGTVYLLWGFLMGQNHPVIGASGAVSAVLVVYAMRWPNDSWTFFYVVPVTAKWLAILYAGLDLYPMLKQLGGHEIYSNTAHSAHIGGMLFGFLYEYYHWNIESIVNRFKFSNPLKRRPKLRIVRDDERASHPELRPTRNEAQLQIRLDELLAKITDHGQSSLTESERAELSEASRYFRERR